MRTDHGSGSHATEFLSAGWPKSPCLMLHCQLGISVPAVSKTFLMARCRSHGNEVDAE